MRSIKCLFLVALLALLAACGQLKKNEAIVNNAQTLPAIRMPAGTRAITNGTYYKVPSNHVGGIPVPIVPPGSNLQRFRSSQLKHAKPVLAVKHQEAHENTKVASAEYKLPVSSAVHHAPETQESVAHSISLSPDSHYLLMMSTTASDAWDAVGQALSATDYKILDKDDVMKTYYILDVDKTHHKVTDNTPIYILDVYQKGNNAEIEITDQYSGHVSVSIGKRILSTIRKALI